VAASIPFVWADTVLNAERQYVARLLVWAALSIIAATVIAVMLAARRIKSPVLKHFALQLGGWGFVLGLVGAMAWQGLHLRDLAGATRLERVTWMRVGFDVGVIGMGAVLAGASRWFGRSLAGMGAGAGMAMQGVALLVIDLQLVSAVSR
jgi:uncharacterized protein DUF6992